MKTDIIQIIDNLNTLSPVVDYARTVDASVLLRPVEATFIFLLYASIFIIGTGKINFRKSLLIFLLATLSSFLLMPYVAEYKVVQNPQTIYCYPLFVTCAILLVQTVFKKYRTMPRIWFSLISVATLFGASLIHLSAISLKLSSQIDELVKVNLLIIESTFDVTDDAKEDFFQTCYKRQMYCRANGVQYIPELNKTKVTNLDKFVEQALGVVGVSEIKDFNEDKSIILSHIDEPFGAPFMVTSFVRNGIERTILDYNNMFTYSNESKFMIYIWVGCLAVFWVWGGLFGLLWHQYKKGKHLGK
ncbi:hypothetical protein [Vibrio crassostreae]|uniref:hypothetical protein n=1 Tax=Vibrio crassostreae TaxID=246167 RepID=UPI001B3105F1|nr:hypothetical protein [Vibrio crassostreae]